MKQEFRKQDYKASLIVVEKALRATCQIMKFKRNTTELPLGHSCGVLFTHNFSYYLFTNAHVIDDIEKERLFILLKGNKRMNIAGQHYMSSMPGSGRRQDDPLDIAVVKLHEKSIGPFHDRGYNFISLADIRTDYDISPSDNFMVAGFPATKTKVDNKNKLIHSKPLIYRTVPYKGGFTPTGFNSVLHFCVPYQIGNLKDSITGEFQRGPKPHGLSGSGLWLFDRSSPEYKINLVGILSEYMDNRALFLSTRIDLFLEIIRKKFDQSLPKSSFDLDLNLR